MKKFLYSAFFGVLLVLILNVSGKAKGFQNSKNFLLKTESTNLTRVGNWPFGSALAVAVDTARNIVYLGSGGAVLILDVSDLSNPQLISDEINSTGLVKDLRYNHSTQHLYVAAHYEDFQIWDVQNPGDPAQLCKYELPNPYTDPRTGNVDFYLNYAITENAEIYVNSIDISDPQNPIWVGNESYMGNPARDIHVASDGKLHATGAQNYVKIYIQPNGNLNAGYSYHLTGGPSVVFGVPDAAFLTYRNYLLIVNTQSYTYPLWSVSTVGYISDIYVQNDYAYFTVSDRLQIYNVANYQSPFPEGFWTIPGYPRKLEVQGNYSYLAGGYSGLRIIDVRTPSQPREAGYFETFSSTTDMDRAGDYGFISELDDGMLVLDLTDLSDPTMVGQYNTPGIAVALEVEGTYAYVADGDGGLRIADVSDPVNPVEVGFLDSLDYVREVCISGDFAYLVGDIVNESDWIRVVDVSDPLNPVMTGEIRMQSNVDALDISGNYLYAAANDGGMRVLDVSDPANPLEVGWFLAPNVYDVSVQGDYAYLASADWDGGFVTVDISDPLHPVFVSTYNWDGWLHPFDVAIEGEYAYVGAPVNDLFLLIYIGDPANPSELGGYRMSGDVLNLFAKDSLVYVSDGVAGLHIFENQLYSIPGGGITWHTQISGTSEDLWSICFANSSNGWVAGDNGIIVKTVDGGQTWMQKPSGTTHELFSVFFLNENTGWAAGREGTIIKSTDGGENWQLQISGTIDVFRSICFIDSITGWAAGENGTILHTTNGGQFWQPQSSGTNVYLMEIDFVDDNHGWVACSDIGMILKTDNGGESWQQVYLPTQASVFSVFFLNQNTGWAATSDVEVFKTTDGGNTWFQQYNNPSSPYDVLTSIYFLDENTGWAVGYHGKIIATTDGGTNWTEQGSGTLTYLTEVHFTDPTNGWISGKEGTVLKNNLSLTAVKPLAKNSENVPDKFMLYNNYPNPFNPATTIKYDLPDKAEVEMKIYNILGREIRTLISGNQSAGTKSVIWNGADNSGKTVSSGIYFYRVKISDNSGKTIVQTKKMIFMQ